MYHISKGKTAPTSYWGKAGKDVGVWFFTWGEGRRPPGFKGAYSHVIKRKTMWSKNNGLAFRVLRRGI